MRKIARRIDEASLHVCKLGWGLVNNHSPHSLPVYIVGAQRSGTNMFGECLNRSLDVDYFPENNPVAFDDYHLRDDHLIQCLIQRSRHKYIVFKPLKDSHQVGELLSLAGNGRAIWMYRRYEDRANSAVHRFGSHNLEVLRDIAQGRRLDIWQAQGLVADDLRLIREFDYGSLSSEAAASLFWYLRNKLFFNQGLEQNPNVFLVCYEELVSNPERVMRAVCQFLECDYRSTMTRHIFATSIGKHEAPNIPVNIHGLCGGMYQKLSAARVSKEEQFVC